MAKTFAAAQARALQGGPRQRSAGDHCARRDPRWGAGALLGPARRYRRRRGRAADQGGLRQLRLGRALFVGDAGLYAKANLAQLSRGAGRYILATPIGRVKEIKDEVLSRPGRYAEIAPQPPRQGGDGRRGRTAPSAKVKAAERLDGKFVLTTNDDTLSAADIALGYKGMWIIEACFRKLKTTGLGIRPMFHWTPRRIVAHVKLCVLALMIQRASEIAAGAPWSQLADAFERLKAVRYTCEGETIVQASRISPELAAILKKLDISRPRPILAVG
jgi:hypothetical protein